MGVGYNPRCVQDGLVLYLDAANRRSYPQSGSVWNDLGPNVNNATLVNSPTFTTTFNGAFAFDGTNDQIDFPTLTFDNTTFTSEIWGKLPGPINTSNRRSLLGGYFTTAYRDYEFSSQTTILARFNLSGLGETFANFGFAAGFLELDKVFHNVFLKRPNNIYEVYFNGRLANKFTPPFNVNGGTVQSDSQIIHSYKHFGSLGASSRMYNGDLYSIRVYSRDLSADEILRNFNATRSRFGI